MSDVTRIIHNIDAGDPHAAGELLPLVYEELRKLAAQKLAHEKPGQTLNATGLVHEAYLRIVGDQHFANSRHFFAAAAEAMRRILVDNARRKHRQKRGGGNKRVELNEHLLATAAPSDELLAIDEALTRLGQQDPEAAAVVQLCYFGGFSVEEAAKQLGMARATAYRHWTFARAWLLQEVSNAAETKAP